MLADGEESNLQSQLYAAKQLVSELVGMDSSSPGYSICSKKRLFNSEATDELRHYHDRLDLDPNRLFELEQRISRQIASRGSIKLRPKSFLTFTSHCWKNSGAG